MTAIPRLPDAGAPARDVAANGAPRRVSRLIVGAIALTLAACGGGDGGSSDAGSPDAGTPDGNGLVLASADAGRAAGEVGEEVLLRNAFARSSAGIGVNIDSLRRLVADDDAGAAPTDPGGQPPGSGEEPGIDGEELLDMVDDGAESLFRRTLGIDDSNARVIREGDVITIDPDDAALCADDPSAGYDDALVLDDDGTTSTCLRLVAGLTTRVEALSADSGVITFLFDGEPVLASGYSPSGVVQELRLSGVALVLERLETIAGLEPGSVVPATLRGTLRWAAHVLDETPGAESGELEISVVEKLEIGDGDSAASLSLEPSRVLRIGADAASDSVTASVGWGALRIVAESGDSDGDTSLTTLNLGALTLDLDASTSDMASAISLRNVGIGGVPLSIRIDSSDALTLALETFGITLDTERGEVTFDTALGVDLMIDNLGGLLEDQARDFLARFTASAPAGTTLVEREDGLLEVGGDGSLTVSLEASDGAGSTRSEISANAGTCIGERDREADGTAGMDVEAERLAADLDLAAFPCP